MANILQKYYQQLVRVLMNLDKCLNSIKKQNNYLHKTFIFFFFYNFSLKKIKI